MFFFCILFVEIFFINFSLLFFNDFLSQSDADLAYISRISELIRSELYSELAKAELHENPLEDFFNQPKSLKSQSNSNKLNTQAGGEDDEETDRDEDGKNSPGMFYFWQHTKFEKKKKLSR